MESQHRAVLATIASIVDAETIEERNRAELISACRTLADWLKQYVEIAAEQSAEIQRLTAEIRAVHRLADMERKPGSH